MVLSKLVSLVGDTMAQQRFTSSFREALWETYDKKCFHGGTELLLLDMRVDHIVPEHLHRGGEEERVSALTTLGLPLDFDILGHGNLVPSCERCNSQKGGLLLIGGAVAIALTRVQRNLPKLEENLKKLRKARQLEDILLAVARSLEKGVFTQAEFFEQLREMGIGGSNETERSDEAALIPEDVWGEIDHKLEYRKLTHQKSLSIDSLNEQRLTIGRDLFCLSIYLGEITARKEASGSGLYVVESNKREIVFTVANDTVTVVSGP